jgi:hypothetical protein
MNIVIEVNMEKKSLPIFMVTIIVLASVLVIPMPGIIAENDSISKEIQWQCCSYIEEEDDDSQDLLILSLPKHNLAI